MANKTTTDKPRPTRKKGWYYNLSFRRRTALWGVIFLLPWLIGFIFFMVKPIIELFIYSVSEVELLAGGQEVNYLGWDNFRYILTKHGSFNRLLLTNLAQAIPSMILILVFSLILAMVLNGKFKGRALFRAIMFIPIIMATDALGRVVGGSQSMMMQTAQGESLTGVAFLANFIRDIMPDQRIADALLTSVSSIFETVLLSGVQTLIFLGGLQAINPSLYEVAKIEGSTAYETFWKVTLPMLSPLILTAAVYTLAEHFMRSPVVDLAYNQAFRASEWGRSAAMSVVFLLVSVITIGLVSLIISRKVFYYD